MSYEHGWAAINLEMPDRVPRTEYSAEFHWDLIKKVTGIDVNTFSSEEIKKKTTSSNSGLIKAASFKRASDGKYTIVVINEDTVPSNITTNISGTIVNTTLRKYVYDTAAVPYDSDGKLQTASASISVANSSFTDTITAKSVIVYTDLPDLTGRDSSTNYSIYK